MLFRYLTIFLILLCFCWVFKPLFNVVLKSVKKVKNDYKKTK